MEKTDNGSCWHMLQSVSNYLQTFTNTTQRIASVCKLSAILCHILWLLGSLADLSTANGQGALKLWVISYVNIEYILWKLFWCILIACRAKMNSDWSHCNVQKFRAAKWKSKLNPSLPSVSSSERVWWGAEAPWGMRQKDREPSAAMGNITISAYGIARHFVGAVAPLEK